MSPFIATQLVGPNGPSWMVWEYDLTKPLRPEAADRRAHYAAKRCLGSYRTRAQAERAITQALGEQDAPTRP